MKKNKLKKLKRRRYKYGNRLQREGIFELIKLILGEVLEKTIKTGLILGKIAIALTKIIAGTFLKATAKRM